MNIMLGNESVSDIERRLGIQLSEEDKDELNRTRQEKINDTPLAEGHWHCFDIPFILVCDTIKTAEKLRDMFLAYDLDSKEQFQIGWER